VVSDDRPTLRQNGSTMDGPDGTPGLVSICECFERQDADLICTALNNAETPTLQAQLDQLTIQPGSVLVMRCPPGRISDNIPLAGIRSLGKYVEERGGVCLLVPDGWSVATFYDVTLQALLAWHAAWAHQGDGRVLAMVEAERLTCRALGLEEHT
jgi:hypothetical protein